MTDLTFTDSTFLQLQSWLLEPIGLERCAVALATQIHRSDGGTRLLVRECELPGDGEFDIQQFDKVVLRPSFVARVTHLAQRRECALVFVHSHPGSDAPRFSLLDDAGEQELRRFLDKRHSGFSHVSMVVSAGGMRARELGSQRPIRIISLGQHRSVRFEPNDTAPPAAEVYDRQVRAFGEAGQRMIERLRIAIVGLGGTGSIVAQQLSHLGTRSFILIDPDVVERTNLNRVVGASPSDVGTAKVHVAARQILSIAPEAAVEAVNADVINARIASHLRDADVIFGCTDSHGSRAVLQQIAYQYLIPCIDMGTTILADRGRITGIYGRVQALSPGEGCFTCGGLLNSSEVRCDMMTPFERKLDPYIQGAREPAPAVISLNGTVASMAVTMFMAMVTGAPSRGRHLVYNGLHSTVRTVHTTPEANCFICSTAGALARGDTERLFARHD